jgi:hypothetical protein
MTVTIVTLVTLILIWPTETLAYIGPGMGVGAIATVLGFVGAIFLGLFAFLYYPIKRMIKKNKKGQDQTTKDETKKAEEDSMGP